MGSIRKGAYQALKNCLSLKKDERFLIITDLETLEVGNAFLKEAEKITDHVRLFLLEDFGKRPLKAVPERLMHEIYKTDVGIFAARGLEGELQGFRKRMLNYCDDAGIRFANMVNINKKIMEQGMHSDYKKIQEFSKKLYKVLVKAKKIKVMTDIGTDFTAEFSPELKWINADGLITEAHWSNLPDGEIYTCPKDVEGIVVIDGVLGDFFAKKYGLLHDLPLKVKIKSGRATSASCNDKDLQDDFQRYISLDRDASRIGEFAMGTNIELKELIGNLLQDEKFPGVHIAFGHGYPERTGCRWQSIAHLDGVLKEPTVIVDGKKIMEKGEYLI